MDYFGFLINLIKAIVVIALISKFETEILTAILWTGELFCRVVFGWTFGPNGFF